jgi:non-ribosomal peptide synthetase component F/thioesterase domain-containing protein
VSRYTHSNALRSAPIESEIDSEANVAAMDTTSVFVFPATPAQRRFWLLDQMQPGGNPALNMCFALRWHGPLDQLVLKRALNEVVARHEALRTTLESERGQLRQLIAPTLVLDLPAFDASDFPGVSFAGLPGHLMREETKRPLDVRAGPLVRGRLVRLAPREYVLVFTIHHIVSDGWSNGILTHDLCALYTAFLENKPSPLPELTIQFADYADWLHARLAGEDFAAQRNYWRGKLAGDLPGLDLPLDRPRLAGSRILSEIRSRMLPPELVRAAKTLGAAENASPFMVFFALFQILLYRYTGKIDFLVTSPSANRERREFEPLVGLFVNPLLLRADLHGDPNFHELLDRVRKVALEAFSNQDIPFESLLDEFQGTTLQVNFQYEPRLPQLADLPEGLTIESVPAVSAGTVYELSAAVLEDPSGLRLDLEYNTALFDAETIDRMLGHYQTLLQNVVSDPAKPISALPLLTQIEKQDLGLEAGEIAAAASAHLDIRAPLVERVMAKPDAVAARHGRREISCAELLARMESARNANKSDRAPSDLEQAAAWVAHWRARVDSAPPAVVARSREWEASLAAGCLALRECAGLIERERVASCSAPGSAATEEIGAALLAHAVLVYPMPGLLADSPTALAAWLETENVAVACLPAAAWNRLAASIAAHKVRKPAKLRLVIATEGDAGQGSFGRVLDETFNGATDLPRVCKRTVMEAEGGTIALNGIMLPATMSRLRVLDARSGQPMPIGVVGDLAIINGLGRPATTGEIARWLPKHSLDRLGRADEQSYARGFRVDLRRTEMALCALPGIRHALVRALKSEPSPPFVAYILPDASVGTPPSDSALRQILRVQGLPDYAIPSAFIPLKDIPLCAEDGRLNRAALPPLPDAALVARPEPVRPYLGLQLQLIAIWEDVLGVRGIGIRDDFFDLGGNSLLAMRMLQRAEIACGKVILPAALFTNATVEHLAGEIAREVIEDSPALLRVHDAGTRPPFFYLHGDLSGGGFYSLKLSRALGQEQPFYVLPPQDIRTLPAAPSIKEMAAAHLAALRTVRPKGPYVIGGFCVGGLVAYELAQQIQASGESVEMLLIIDATAEDKGLRALSWLARTFGTLLHWDDQAKVDHFGRWTLWRGRLARWSGLGAQAQARVAIRRISNRFVRAFNLLCRGFRRGTDQSTSPAESHPPGHVERDVPSAFLWASARYRPQPYHGAVALLLSEDVVRHGRNVSEWRELAPKVTVHPLMGSHLECITAHVDTLAQTIEGCLQSAGADSRPIRQSHDGPIVVACEFQN